MDALQPDSASFDCPTSPHRDWLANLLLQQHKRWLGRFALRLTQLNALQRGQRLRLQRKAAVSLAGAALVLSLGAGMLAQPTAVHAANITVTTSTANGFVNDGYCSISEAIANANNGAQTYSDCDPGVIGPDTITLAGNTYTLNAAYGGSHYFSGNGLPVITSEITIEGNSATIERDSAAADFRILAVTFDSGLILNDATISGGKSDNYGGGLYTTGYTALNNSTVSNNTSKFGGGIFALYATMNVVNSTISGNEAVYGGGIWHWDGTTNVDYTTISDNSAKYGAGIYTFSGDVNLVNCTVSGNTASFDGGGLYIYMGSLSVSDSTVSDNSADRYGGGLFTKTTFSQTTLIHSVISGNGAVNDGDEILHQAGTINADDYNLFGDSGKTTAQAFFNFTPGATDVNATSNGANPTALASILSPLADNGGPTLTHALVLDSPAIDLAPSGPATDQRGVTRPQLLAYDAGAFEYEAAVPPESYCPVDPNVGYTKTDLIGTGQGSKNKGYRTRKLAIPHYQDVVSLYGQLAAVRIGFMKYVRFLPQGEPKVQVPAPTSPAYRSYAIDWWGAELPAGKQWIKGQFFWGKKGDKSPRAFVLWPTYSTDEPYANVFTTFGDSNTNYVAWESGFTATHTQVIPIPETQTNGATVVVHVAIVDNDKDNRPILLDVTVGLETQSNADTKPNMKDTLNLYELTFTDVPAGVNQVSIKLTSPNGTGDGAAMIGAAVNYACTLP